ncbi:MAG: hypothetical protein JWR13_5177 [Mycobacterium sp.]|nr:hypothetical protein [Mycobacterium sp.]
MRTRLAHSSVSLPPLADSLGAVSCKDIGGRGGDRTHDRRCVNALTVNGRVEVSAGGRIKVSAPCGDS